MLRLIVTFVLLPMTAGALEPIDHPDPAQFSGSVGNLFSEAQQNFFNKEDSERSGEDYGRVAMIYHAHEQHGPASQAYRNAAEKAPADARWPYFLGILAANDGEFDAAIAYFEAAQKANPDYAPARIRLSRVLRDAGRQDEARVVTELLNDDIPGIAAVVADLGTIALQGQQYDKAVALLQQALSLQPDASRLHYPLGLAYRSLGDTDKAKEHLQQTGDREVFFNDPLFTQMKSLSGSFAYFLSVGMATARTGNYELAAQFMRSAMEAEPDRPEPRINYARMLEAQGKVDAAAAELRATLEDHPNNALAHFNLGAVSEIQSQDSAAREHYAQTVALQPDMFEAWLLLGNSHMRAGQFDQAIEAYDQAFSLRPGRTGLLLRKGIAQIELNQCRGAVTTLLELVRKKPEDFEALIAYSRTVAVCPEASPEDRGNALAASRNMYALNPGLPVVTTLAMAEAAVGHFDLAIDFQTQALFQAARDGLDGQVERLRENLERFEKQQPAERPWAADHPVLNPPRLTVEIRK